MQKAKCSKAPRGKNPRDSRVEKIYSSALIQCHTNAMERAMAVCISVREIIHSVAIAERIFYICLRLPTLRVLKSSQNSGGMSSLPGRIFPAECSSRESKCFFMRNCSGTTSCCPLYQKTLYRFAVYSCPAYIMVPQLWYEHTSPLNHVGRLHSESLLL